MQENTFENTHTAQEKFDVNIQIAKPGDWKDYKAIVEEMSTGNDAEMLGMTFAKLNEIKHRKDEDWIKILEQNGRFVLLAKNNSIVIATITATENEEDWYMGSLYVKEGENFRRKGIGKKIFAKCLKTIAERGGHKVTVGVKAHNFKSIGLVKQFYFKQPEDMPNSPGYYMSLEDVNAPEVVKKINEILDAG